MFVKIICFLRLHNSRFSVPISGLWCEITVKDKKRMPKSGRIRFCLMSIIGCVTTGAV